MVLPIRPVVLRLDRRHPPDYFGEEKDMPDIAENPLAKLSEAVAERVGLAKVLVAGIVAPGHRMRAAAFSAYRRSDRADAFS